MSFRQSIPAFLGGISQQSKAIRPSNLVDDAVNMEFMPSEGATKRYPTEHITDLSFSLDPSKAHAVPMPRDDKDYIVIVDDSAVRVVDTDGNEETVTELDNAFDYLTGATHDSFRFQQVADTLYVVNTDTTVVGAPGKDYAPWRQEGDAGVFIKQTAYDHTYTLTVGAASVSVTTQATPNSLGGLGYSSSVTNASGQPYKLTVGQAAGTDPIFVDALQTSARSNKLSDFDCRTIAPSRISLGSSIPSGGAALGMVSQPLDGQPTAGTWNTNYSNGSGIDPFDAAHFDPDFQALYLDPLGGHSAGDWIAVSRSAITNESQISPSYVARTLANALVVIDPSITVEAAYMTLPSSEVVESSSFFLTTGAASANPLSLEVEDASSSPVEDYAYLWVDEVEEITHLPVFYKHGAVVRVTGSIGSSAEDDYFVQFATEKWATETDSDEGDFYAAAYADLFDRGFWRETAAPGQTTGGYDSSTMPHRLQRNPGTNWSFSPVNWAQRSAGDQLTSPEPSFVGGRIFDIFYHEDRLGFASDANVIFSESGEIENFWRTTVLSLPDSDPIDITLASLGGSAVYHVVPFERGLYAFAENAQALISGGGGALGPSTVSARVTANYRNSPAIRPVTQGFSLFSPYLTGDSTQIRELFPGRYEGELQAAEITLGVPRLLPNTVRKVLTSGGSNDLMCLTDDGRIFLYQYLRAGDQSLMSAWGRWEFPGGTLVDAAAIEDTAYLLVLREGASQTYTCLERVSVGAGRGDVGSSFKVRSDRLVSVASGTYDITTDTTTFDAGFPFVEEDVLQVTADSGGDLERGAGLSLVAQYPLTGLVDVAGDHSAQPVFIGVQYDSTIEMTRPVVQAPSQRGGTTSVVGGNTHIRDFVVTLTDTGYLKATVEAVGQATTTEEFLADRMDVGELTPSALSSREFLVPIHASSDEFRLTLSNDTAMPSTLVNGAWAIRFNARYRQS